VNKPHNRQLVSVILLLLGVSLASGAVWVKVVSGKSIAAAGSMQGSGCVTATSGGPWQNGACFQQTGSFAAEFDATPLASPIDSVVGLSRGAQTAYTGFAALVRFNPSGNIDAPKRGSLCGDIDHSIFGQCDLPLPPGSQCARAQLFDLCHTSWGDGADGRN
jgi:hypothetical protein